MTSTITAPVSVQDKVRNYQGQNRFLLNLKDSLKKWGGLTQKQVEAAHKALNSQVKTLNTETVTENIKKILEYSGENAFVKAIGDKFKQYGTLSTKQIQTALGSMEREENKKKSLTLNIPAIGETIKVGRGVGIRLKEKYNLNFNPILMDITKVVTVTPKAILFEGKLTVKRGDVCTCCMKTLTDEFSMLTGMGKICAKNVGVEYITDASQAERFRNEYLKRVEEIGAMQFWVPKSQIKMWESSTASFVKSI